jgi:ribonuclease G
MEKIFRLGIFSKTQEQLFFAICENGRLVYLKAFDQKESPDVGEIYKAQVFKKLPSVGCDFVRLAEEKKGALFLLPHESPNSLGGHVLVQVKKKAYGTKYCRVSSQIDLKGRFVVYMPNGPSVIGVSQKIKGEASHTLKETFREMLDDKEGLILRSAAVNVDDSVVLEEVLKLKKVWQNLKKEFRKAPAASLLLKSSHFVLDIVQNKLNQFYDHLLVDDLSICKILKKELKEDPFGLEKRLQLVSQKQPLFFSCGLDLELRKALASRQWLPCGGCLIIEETEAFISIDVNSSRYAFATSPEETILRVNLEAAIEIAHHIVFRDMGGMVLIDFIDMHQKAHQDEVLQALKTALKPDPRISFVSDFSKLGIVQISRRREEQSLSQQFLTDCPYCEGTGRIETERFFLDQQSQIHQEQIRSLSSRFQHLKEGLSIKSAEFPNRQKGQLLNIDSRV